MKKLLEDYLKREINSYSFGQYIESILRDGDDYNTRRQYIETDGSQPFYQVIDRNDIVHNVYLDDLLMFMYDKIGKV